jgi:cellobiose-specific phosphotransferase system component IIC
MESVRDDWLAGSDRILEATGRLARTMWIVIGGSGAILVLILILVYLANR